jgi:hypothetical protein
LGLFPGFTNDFTIACDRIYSGYSDSTYLVDDEKQDLINEFNEFLSWPNNWDGYNSVPLQRENYNNAVKLVKLLSKSAVHKISDHFSNPNGTLTITWENEKNWV